MPSRCSQEYLLLWSLRPCKRGNSWQNTHSKDRGGVNSRINQQSCLLADVLQHSTPPDPMTSSYNLTCTHPLPKCTLSSRWGVLVAWRWLLWQLSGCPGGRYHSSNRDSCKRKHTSGNTSQKKQQFFPPRAPWLQPLIYEVPWAVGRVTQGIHLCPHVIFKKTC